MVTFVGGCLSVTRVCCLQIRGRNTHYRNDKYRVHSPRFDRLGAGSRETRALMQHFRPRAGHTDTEKDK